MKIGLALGGGGAKGAYQVGVLKALEEYELIDYISTFSGTSIGAVNSYFYLSQKENNDLYNAWIYGLENNPLDEKRQPFDKETKGFFSLDVINEMAELYTLKEKFKNTDKDVYVVVTKIDKPTLPTLVRKSQWEKVTVHLNKEEKPLDYVLSSASVPVVFGFQEVEENYYVDGGLVDNNPVEILYEQGCNVIFYCPLHRTYKLEKYKDKDVTFIELLSTHAMPRFIRNYLSVIDFEKDTFKNRLHYGYFVTKNMIEYLISLDVLTFIDNKLVFNKREEGFNHILIPDEIHEALKILYKETNK